jgi:hypothetical protein
MMHSFQPSSSFLVCALALAACSSSSTPATTHDSGVNPGTDAGAKHDSGTTKDTGTAEDTGSTKDTGAPKDTGTPIATMTIAAARQSNPTGPITVKGFVTALGGVPGDYPTWYIEDPAGGQYSGVDVYCDPLATTKCTVPEPALHDLISLTGTLTTYMGQVEFEPTAMMVVQSNAMAPPVAALTAADIAPTGNSPYRGVYVSLTITAPTKLVVDSVTPKALADTGTSCAANFDAGVPQCTNLCEGPVYSGFQANDGTGNEVYIEAPFFHTDPLQSSPECLTQTGVVPVIVGTTFSKMEGILDFDGYAMSQALSPVQTSDYVTP